jgi:excisionase family DNA binding protein
MTATRRLIDGEGGGTPPLMDIEGVAERLGVRVRHVRRLVNERRIPFIKWGHLLRFDPEEIERWLDGSRRPPAA